jgi:hypothetical protein
MHEGLESKLYRRVCVLLLFFVAASASFEGFFTKWHFREPGVVGGVGDTTEWRFGLVEMLEGTAIRPYVYRQLLPTFANWVDHVTPQKIKDKLYRSSSKQIEAQDFIFVSPLARNPTYFFRYLVLYVTTFLFAWLSVFAMYLVCGALDVPPLARACAPVLMILAIPYFMSVGGYYYDYPELAFMALAVWMALKFDWWWMLPVVALATWNKESFLFVVLTLYPLLRARSSRASALLGTCVLALTSAAVYAVIRVHFLNNPGGTVLDKWSGQLAFLLHPANWFRWERTYGIPMFRAFTILPLVLIAWTAWRGWRFLPREIQRHGQLAALINFPLFFLFCAAGEMRDLSMLYIVFMLLLAVNLMVEAGIWADAWAVQEQEELTGVTN